MSFEEVRPDAKQNWIGVADTDFDSLLPLIDKRTKAGANKQLERAIFRTFSRGVSTQRDEWVYDFSQDVLEKKMRFFVDTYERARKRKGNFEAADIKWDRELAKYRDRSIPKRFEPGAIVMSLYRPFCRLPFYFDRHFNGMIYQWDNLSRSGDASNHFILYTQPGSQKPFMVGASNTICDLHYVGAAAATECLPLYSFDDRGGRLENITDWALEQFRKHYESGRDKKHAITKETIFHYVYGVLHDPVYCEKYTLNLKREFPRIPFYKDFWQWAEWGKELMDLHIGYESVTLANLKRIDLPDEKARKAGLPPKCILKADKEGGRIVVDSETTLTLSRPKLGNTDSATAPRLNGFSTSTKKRNPKTQPSAKSSTPTALRSTRKKRSTCLNELLR